MKQKIISALTLAAFGLFSLLMIGCAPSANASSNGQTDPKEPTPVPPLPEDVAAATSIANSNKVPLVEIKTAVAETNEKVVRETEEPRPTPITGIFAEGMLVEAHPPRTVEVSNVWQDLVNGTIVKVWAGRLKPDYRNPNHGDDTEHGSIYIEIYGDDPWDLSREQFQTAEENGPLTLTEALIIDQDHFVLTLETENGITYQFDSEKLALETVD